MGIHAPLLGVQIELPLWKQSGIIVRQRYTHPVTRSLALSLVENISHEHRRHVREYSEKLYSL